MSASGERPFEPETVDFHTLDTCGVNGCEGKCDHWKTTTQWRTPDGKMVYRSEWICQKCGAQEDRYEDARGHSAREMEWVE